MSYQHIKLCRQYLSDRKKAVYWDGQSVELHEVYNAHPPELLLAMHEAVAIAAKLRTEILRQLEQCEGHEQFEFFSPELDIYDVNQLRQAVARYEELTCE